jgi:bacterial/archaeal transporter family-2 protein
MSSGFAWLWLLAAITVGLVAGFLFGTQPSVNGHLSRQLGHPLQASIVSFASGTLILIVLAIAMGVFPPRLQTPISDLPWWCWGGGAIGVLLVTASLIFVPRIGSLPWHATIVAGQLVAAMVLDHFALLGNPQEPMTKARWLGASLLIAGVAVIFWAKSTPTAEQVHALAEITDPRASGAAPMSLDRDVLGEGTPVEPEIVRNYP